MKNRFLRKIIGSFETLLLAEFNLIELRDTKSYIPTQEEINKREINYLIFEYKCKKFRKKIKNYFQSNEFKLGIKVASFFVLILSLPKSPVLAIENVSNQEKRRNWKQFIHGLISYESWKNYFAQKTEYTNLARTTTFVSGFILGLISLTLVNIALSSASRYFYEDNLEVLTDLNTSLQETINMLIFKYGESKQRHLKTYAELKIMYELLKRCSGIEIPGEIPPPPIYNLDLPNTLR